MSRAFFARRTAGGLTGYALLPVTAHRVPDTEAEFTMRYMMLIHQDEVALAEAPPSLWGDYAAGKVN